MEDVTGLRQQKVLGILEDAQSRIQQELSEKYGLDPTLARSVAFQILGTLFTEILPVTMKATLTKIIATMKAEIKASLPPLLLAVTKEELNSAR